MRTVVARMVAFVLFCYGVIPVAGAAHFGHELAHLSDVAGRGALHHHAQDGTIQQDRSDASFQHAVDHLLAAFGTAVLGAKSDVAFVGTLSTFATERRIAFYQRFPSVPHHPPKRTFG